MGSASDKYDYVDEDSIDSELMCGICSRPLVEPVDLPCSHSFCGACVTRLCRATETRAAPSPARGPDNVVVEPTPCTPSQGNTSGPIAPASSSSIRHICPLDRQEFTEADVVPTKGIVIKLLDKLAVLCPHAAARQSSSGGDGAAGQGCVWSGPRSNVHDHLRSCLHYPCPQRVSGCVYRGAAGAVQAHVQSACEYTMVACSVCGHHQVRRAALRAHEEACAAERDKAARLAEYQAYVQRERERLREAAIAVQQQQQQQPEPEQVRVDRVERGQWGRVVAGERLQVVKALRRVSVEAGGRRFDTSVATLRKYPESVLGVWAGEAAPGDCLFVDMDPDVFKLILSWVRR